MTATGHPHAHAVHQMAEAASNWLASLDAQQKAKATYPFLDGERIFWYFAPLNRHGLPLRDMDMVQRGLAMEIVDAMLDEDGARKVRDIIKSGTHPRAPSRKGAGSSPGSGTPTSTSGPSLASPVTRTLGASGSRGTTPA